MATHSSILAWRIPGSGGPGGLQSWTRLSDTHTHTHTHTQLGSEDERQENGPERGVRKKDPVEMGVVPGRDRSRLG